ERLVLRGHTVGDLDDSAAMWADPAVVRHIGGRPFTREEVWNRLLRYIGHWELLGYGYWVVAERATGRFAGELGYADGQRDIAPPVGDARELGWALAPAFHGRGLATEAVRAVQAWGDGRFSGARTVCIIDPENAASLRVAAKCGFRQHAMTSYKGGPTIVF